MCRFFLVLVWGLSFCFFQVQAEVLPTSTTQLSENQCRLDLYHLEKNRQKQFVSTFQVALITDNQFRQRFVALKADIDHPAGFENIRYFRTGSPVEVFTANWRKNGNLHTVARLVLLGGTSDKQGFDVLTKLIVEDKGHFELLSDADSYRFNIQPNDLKAFLTCVNTYYH